MILMKHILLSLAALALIACGSTQTTTRTEPVVPVSSTESPDAPVVYFTSDISPEGLLNIYNALGCKPEGKVGVKISTGESSKTNYLRPEFIAPLVKAVNGTLIECNTAYGGARMKTEDHRKAIAERALAKGITTISFDRGGYLFHGRVKSLADAAREGGLIF